MAKRRKEKPAYWGALVLDWFKYLQDPNLTSADYKILFFLCQNMNMSDNITNIKQKQISEILNMDKGNVSKCIKKLCEKQFIAKDQNGFMINPNLFYVGKRYLEDREELRESFDELLVQNNLEIRFSLYEEEHTLEEYPNRSEATWDD